MPKSFDPALAAAPPETDVVRAVYEGLTDTDAKTLKTIPAIAADWKSSDDYKTWTFNLRRDAKWSNGERVTAKDFVRSWNRVAEMGEKISHPELLENIVGLKISGKENLPLIENKETNVLLNSAQTPPLFRPSNTNSAVNTKIEIKPLETVANANSQTKPALNPKSEKPVEAPFGIEAVDNFTLKVALVKPDKNFPALVAYPLFRPVYGDGKEFETGKLNADIVTNGAFRIFSIGQDGVTLDRAENYWNKESVQLERVRFVPMESAEKALEAYRAGEIDALTNIEFEPLALKLLTPFEDFRRTPHAALNFYEFNLKNPPFDDHRVREALAIAIERDRLTDDEMDGASKPALSFTPFGDDQNKLVQDAERAKTLLREAGFPNGENFPTIKLVVNRNNLQQRIARSVAKMWKQNLNIETEIVVKESSEIAAVRTDWDFDVLRRGVILPTTNETANMLAIISPVKKNESSDKASETIKLAPNQPAENSNSSALAATVEQLKVEDKTGTLPTDENLETPAEDETIATEAQAISDLPAIPLYFPTSYSLVKPYISGFETNAFDAPSLKDVRIDNNWQPKKARSAS